MGEMITIPAAEYHACSVPPQTSPTCARMTARWGRLRGATRNSSPKRSPSV